MGMWYGSEVINHRDETPEDKSFNELNTCVVVHLSEIDVSKTNVIIEKIIIEFIINYRELKLNHQEMIIQTITITIVIEIVKDQMIVH